MGKINYPLFGEITFNDKYSNKDFTGKILLESIDLEDTIIYGSCFSQETPFTRVFPDNIKHITFYNCNLDNVLIVKPGWITIGCSELSFRVQNDLRDWEIDGAGKPIKVLNEKYWINEGLSVDPNDIPAVKINNITEIRRVVV